MVKNTNRQGADRLAIYKLSRGAELVAIANNTRLVVRTRHKPATSEFQAQRSNHSATVPAFYALKFSLIRGMGGPRASPVDPRADSALE